MSKSTKSISKSYIVRSGKEEIGRCNGSERAVVIGHHHKFDGKKMFIDKEWECKIPDPKEEGKTKNCTAFTTLGKYLGTLPVGEKLTMKGLEGQGTITIKVIERPVDEVKAKRQEKQDAKAKDSKTAKTAKTAVV